MAKRKRQAQRDDARDLRATHTEPDEEGYVLGEALEKLRREIEHDTGLRRLEDRGVKYEDEAERKLDQAGDYDQALDDSARRAQHHGKDKSKDRGR